MSTRLLLLCSGQGGQYPGMFDLARRHPASAALLAQPGVSADPADMFDNAVAQPSIVAATLAMWLALRERVVAPDLVAGYSIGELAAWAVAGALDPLEAMGLSRCRAAAMDAAARAGPEQVLAAVSGIAVDEVAAMSSFEIAIVNGYDACIAGGLEQDWQQLAAAVAGRGGKLQRLPVAVASHTSLMEAAVGEFRAALEAQAFGVRVCPVLSGVRAVALRDKGDAVQDLSVQLAQTIRWSDCMDAAAEAGISVALELGPGAALARMMKARHPHIACRSVADFRTLDGIVAWVERQTE